METYALVRPRAHAPTHPRAHAPTRPRTHAPTHPRTHAPTHRRPLRLAHLPHLYLHPAYPTLIARPSRPGPVRRRCRPGCRCASLPPSRPLPLRCGAERARRRRGPLRLPRQSAAAQSMHTTHPYTAPPRPAPSQALRCAASACREAHARAAWCVLCAVCCATCVPRHARGPPQVRVEAYRRDRHRCGCARGSGPCRRRSRWRCSHGPPRPLAPAASHSARRR
jgi:hypothetical protein